MSQLERHAEKCGKIVHDIIMFPPINFICEQKIREIETEISCRNFFHSESLKYYIGRWRKMI